MFEILKKTYEDASNFTFGCHTTWFIRLSCPSNFTIGHRFNIPGKSDSFGKTNCFLYKDLLTNKFT